MNPQYLTFLLCVKRTCLTCLGSVRVHVDVHVRVFIRIHPYAGYKAQQFVDLVNCEEETFHFAILESSLLCDDQKSLLKLEPLSGVIQPNARSADQKLPKNENKRTRLRVKKHSLCFRLSLSVSFTPCCKGQKRFRLVLRMKKKPEPLVLTVKASCLPMAASLQVKMPDCVTRRINPDKEETLNFGEVAFPTSWNSLLWSWGWMFFLSVIVLLAGGKIRTILFLFPVDQSVKIQHGCEHWADRKRQPAAALKGRTSKCSDWCGKSSADFTSIFP